MKSFYVTVEQNYEVSPGYYLMALSGDTSINKVPHGSFVMLSFNTRTDPLLPRPMGIFQILKQEKGRFEFTIGYVVVGKGTALMASVRPGERLRCLAPLGNGWDVESVKSADEVILVGGGIGITPLYTIGKLAADSGKKTSLLFGGRSADDLVFKEHFEELGISCEFFTDDGSFGTQGLVTQGLEKKLRGGIEVLACGPTGMLKAVSDICLGKEIDAQLSFDKRMACGFGVCLGCNIGVKREEKIYQVRACKEGPVFRASEVAW